MNIYFTKQDVKQHLNEFKVNFSDVKGLTRKQLDDYSWNNKTIIHDDLCDHDDIWNTYNDNLDVVFRVNTFTINGVVYSAINYHIKGDVRANYAPVVLYKLDREQLLEVLFDLKQSHWIDDIYLDRTFLDDFYVIDGCQEMYTSASNIAELKQEYKEFIK